ncbi:MAG TPA: 30S ribosomal protein S20 [Burkholderiales bacterium]|nr:30S ribosomal protein S20 [Burkholderiales bacterium]
MAHTISAKKRIRQTERRTIQNKARTSRIRTFVRKVEEAVRAGDKNAAESAYKAMMPELHKGVSKGLLHRNTVARKLSRLSARIKSL